MACRGVHFALNEDEVARLRGVPEDRRPRHVTDVVEETYFADHPEWLAESDKAWDAIHRALTDGRLGCGNATYPLDVVVIGGEQLYRGSDWLLSLKTPQQVRDVAPRLSAITEDEFRRRYFAIDASDYAGNLDEVDCGYSWDWFQHVREFWLRAAEADRWVLFSVSQ